MTYFFLLIFFTRSRSTLRIVWYVRTIMNLRKYFPIQVRLRTAPNCNFYHKSQVFCDSTSNKYCRVRYRTVTISSDTCSHLCLTSIGPTYICLMLPYVHTLRTYSCRSFSQYFFVLVSF